MILADEMGLGKTIQMLGLVWYARYECCEEHVKSTTVLLASSTLIQQWKKRPKDAMVRSSTFSHLRLSQHRSRYCDT